MHGLQMKLLQSTSNYWKEPLRPNSSRMYLRLFSIGGKEGVCKATLTLHYLVHLFFPRLDLMHVVKGLLPVFTSHGHDQTLVRDVFRNLNDVIHLRSVDREEEVITSIEGDQGDYMVTVSPSTSHIICRMMRPMPTGMIKSSSAYRTYSEQSETWWISDDIRHQILTGRGTAFQGLSSTSPELKWIVQLLQIVGAVSLFATKILI
jgi:hypothetical protein